MGNLGADRLLDTREGRCELASHLMQTLFQSQDVQEISNDAVELDGAI